MPRTRIASVALTFALAVVGVAGASTSAWAMPNDGSGVCNGLAQLTLQRNDYFLEWMEARKLADYATHEWETKRTDFWFNQMLQYEIRAEGALARWEALDLVVASCL